MGDCSSCKREKQPELTSEQQTFLLALESNNARWANTIKWVVKAFVACVIIVVAIFAWMWTSYDYYGEDTDINSEDSGIAAYIGDRGVIINGENNNSAESTD